MLGSSKVNKNYHYQVSAKLCFNNTREKSMISIESVNNNLSASRNHSWNKLEYSEIPMQNQNTNTEHKYIKLKWQNEIRLTNCREGSNVFWL